MSCNDCEVLKEAIQGIHSAIEKYSSLLSNKEKEDDLRHDALVDEEKVKEPKAHIMRAHNQEKCKQSVLLSLLEDEVFILSDWAMKFVNKVSRKAIRIVWKERHKLAYMLVIVKIGGKLEVSSYAHLLNSCGHTTHDWFAVLSILGQHMTVIQNKPSNHYNGVPKIRRSGLLSQQQSLNGPSRCRKSSGSWRCEIKFFGTTAR